VEPDDFANLELWLKAEVGQYEDDAATDPATSQGNVIAVWQDQSGNARHATQTVNANRPTLEVTDGLNGYNAVKFAQSASQQLNLPNFLTGFTYGEIFAIVKAAADPQAGSRGFWNFGSHTDDDLHPHSDSGTYQGFGSTARKTTGNPSLPLNEYHLLHVMSKASNWRMSLNAGEFFTTGTNTVGWTTTPTLGKSRNAFWWDGNFVELWMYSTEKTITERSQLLEYIGDKFGIVVMQCRANALIAYPDGFGAGGRQQGYSLSS